MAHALPRVVVAALAGDAGKTLVSVGLVRALHNRGHVVAPYKKGPDYIDAAWLGAAAGRPAHNLDTFMMPEKAVLRSLAKAEVDAGIALIEGNRGLFDGLTAEGTHSTAELAKLTKTPLVLIVNAAKSTRTIAAQVLGCRCMDPDLDIKGVIINRIGTKRQEEIVRASIRSATGLEVFGCIPRLTQDLLPSRHLGLVTNAEHPASMETIERLCQVVERYVDVPAILETAQKADSLPLDQIQAPPCDGKACRKVRIAVLKDPGFSFYYPENLADLEDQGADLIDVSPLLDQELPDVHALYVGGGFPEIYAATLSANRSLRNDLAEKIRQGLPVWAECGGLMYLSKALVDADADYPMVGAIDIVCEQTRKPQGHGYVKLRVDRENPFIGQDTEIYGHEFHYSFIRSGLEGLKTVFRVERGVGLGNGRDGILTGNVLASYTHVHALGLPQWGKAFVEAAEGKTDIRQVVGTQKAAKRPIPRATGLASHRLDRLKRDQEGASGRISGGSKAFVRVGSPEGGDSKRRFPYLKPQLMESREKGASGGIRERIDRLVRDEKIDELTALVARQARAVRYLVGLSYHSDEQIRKIAVQGIARAGRYHPDLVQNIIRRLVWAMNDESCTNAVTAPEVLRAVSEEQPELLLPVVPDLVRLREDKSLQRILGETLRTVARSCPDRMDEETENLLSQIRERGAGCEAGG